MSKVFVVRTRRVIEVDVLVEANSLPELKRSLRAGLDRDDVIDMNIVDDTYVDFITQDYDFDRDVTDNSGSYWDFSLIERTEPETH